MHAQDCFQHPSNGQTNELSLLRFFLSICIQLHLLGDSHFDFVWALSFALVEHATRLD